MPRFDFTGFAQQRDGESQRQERTKPDKEQRVHETWVELKRQIGNYVQGNGSLCEVSAAWPQITLAAADDGLLIIVKDLVAFEVTRMASRYKQPSSAPAKTAEVSGEQEIMATIVDWYEAISRN